MNREEKLTKDIGGDGSESSSENYIDSGGTEVNTGGMQESTGDSIGLSIEQGSKEQSRKEQNPEEQNPEEPNLEPSEPEPVKFHIPLPVILFLAALIALDLFSMIRFPKVLAEYKTYMLAEERTRKGETAQAISDLYTLAEQHTNSVPILVKLTDLSMDNGYYDTAGYVIDSYLVGKSLSDSEYNRVDGYYTKLENYYTTVDAVEKIFNNADNKDIQDESYYEDIKGKLKDLLSQDNQDAAYLYYCLASFEADTEAAAAYMQQCYDLDPNCYDVRGQLGIMYRRLGKPEAAIHFVKEALQKDKQDVTALRAMAAIHLVNGELEEGLQNAKDAYEINADGTYVRDTYLIALAANGRMDEADKIREEITSQGMVLDEETKQFLEGKLSLEEYYIGE